MGLPVYDGMSQFDASFYRCFRHMFDESVLNYVRYFLQLSEGTKFLMSAHHKLIAEVIEDVLAGRRKRVIINVPPGTTKTELAVKGLIGKGLGMNPRARFIHTSVSDDLALRNSEETRDVIQTEEYQAIYPETRIRGDVKGKKYWKTTEGGGVFAVATGGNVLGFRAGRMEPGFQGAVVVDDPTKPDDISSDLKRKRQNERFVHTIRTRIANPDTPIVVIMQRLHDDDLSGFLLKGGSGDVWDHLCLPVLIPEVDDQYPTEYTHGNPIPHNLEPGPLWEYKYGHDEIKILKADDYTFSAQFMQSPSSYGGGVFNDAHWKGYLEYDPKKSTVTLTDGTTVDIKYKNVYCDTAMKTGEQNDYSVFQLWGYGSDGRIYLLDQVRGKYEAPQLKQKFLRFCEKHEYGEFNKIGIRARKIEDKASGIGLIQELIQLKGKNFVIGIPRDRDKFSRARSGTIPIAEGLVVLPLNAYWIDDYRYEFRQFSPLNTHKYDDQIDPTLDAISDMLTKSTTSERYLKLIGGFKE